MRLDDTNGDRSLGVIATHATSTMSTCCSATAKAGLRQRPDSTQVTLEWTIAAVDLSQNRRNDLVIAGAAGLKAFLGIAKDSFTSAPEWSVATPCSTWEVVAADFNRDSKPDLAYPDVDGRTVAVMLHQ